MSVPPITTVLPRLGWSDPIDSPEYGELNSYDEVVRGIFHSLENGSGIPEYNVTQGAITLFGAIPNSYLRYICTNMPVYGPSGSGWSYAIQLSAAFRRFLLRKLYWFGKLKPRFRAICYQLCNTKEGWLRLSNIMQSVEGRVVAIIEGLGDKTSYEELDSLNVCLLSNKLNDPFYDKKVKAYQKKCRKAFFAGEEFPVPPGNISWLRHHLNKIDKTKRGASYRVVTVCQGRTCGLPSREIMLDSLNKWRNTTSDTDVPSEFDEHYYDLLELQLLMTPVRMSEVLAHMRVNVSTSACIECPRAKGGKTAYARHILQVPEIRKVDLHTGKDAKEVVNSRKQPGEALFHFAASEIRDNFKSQMNVRASVVNEPGAKARVVTSGNFCHSIFLCPWAHAWYHVLKKFPAAKIGLTEGRHGWAFIRGISASSPSQEWLFNNAVYAVCTDLSEATDKKFWAATRVLLRMANRVLQFPDWYMETVIELLCSKRFVEYNDGKFAFTSETSNGVFMGDTGAKVILTMDGLLAVARISQQQFNYSIVDGDDFASIVTRPEECLRVYRSTMEGLGYELSEDDTFISRNYVFLAEETMRIPKSTSQTVDANLAVKGRLPYVDVNRVRLQLDLKKDRKDFSSTLIGRIHQLGKEVEYNMRPTNYLGLTYLGSWIQDIILDLRFKPEIVYFPRALCGTGKPMLFGSKQNFKRFISHQKNGKIKNHYAHIMNMALTPNRNNIPQLAVKLFTHSNESFLEMVEDIPLPDGIEEHLVFTDPSKRWYKPWLVTRLGEYIISETEIKSRLSEIFNLFGERGESEPVNVYTISRNVAEELHDAIFDRFCLYWKENNVLLSYGKPQKYYKRREVEEFLDYHNPMRVEIDVIWHGRITAEPPLDLEFDREKRALYEWLLTGNEDNIPQTLIPDDLVLVRKYTRGRNSDLVCVTDDLKLLRYIATFASWRSGWRVYQIRPLRWIQCGYSLGMDSEVLRLFSTFEVEVDEGSLDYATAVYMDSIMDIDEIFDLDQADSLTIKDIIAIRPFGRGDYIPKEVRQAESLERLDNL
jgi:hypothetical protein